VYAGRVGRLQAAIFGVTCVGLACGGTGGQLTGADTEGGGLSTTGQTATDSESGGSGSTGGTSGSSSGGMQCEMWATPWIGGACGHDDDCGYDGGYCLMEEEGFPCGTCSTPCDGLCPDLDGAPITFCVDTADLGLPDSQGACISQCAPELLGGDGCRDGYDCLVLNRYMEAGTAKAVCVPQGAVDPSSCRDDLDARGLIWEPAVHQVESPDGFPQLLCEIEDPVVLHSPVGDLLMVYKGDGSESPVKVSCELARRIDDMAEILSGMDAVQFEHWGTYNCRVIAGTENLSVHGLGSAIDLVGFTLSDDTVYTVLDHWEIDIPGPVTPGGQWLKTLADTLWDMMVFNIILTPNHNAAHADHFHVDLTPGGNTYD
jgi:hypothetical protein